MARPPLKPRTLPLLLGAIAFAGGSLAAQIPTPESVLGFRPGDDFRLATYEESLEYFRRLDAASDRVTLVETGRTSFGRPWFFALVSSAENLRDVERHREVARRLAEVDGLGEAEARSLAREGKAIVDINGGLHASEVAGAQHTLRLAYELVAGADTDPRTAAILDEVIVMLWPSLNPDGQTMVAEWYRSNLGTPHEVAPLPMLYQKYVGHDNNRDAYMLNVRESREVARTWREWEPQIIYVHHQSSPFPTRIWLPPFAEPIAPRAPPLMSRTVNAIGMSIAHLLESRGQPGAVHMGTGFDAWYPGYIDYLPMLRNQAAFWTETALYRYATPRFYTLSDFPPDRRDLRAESLYPSPWEGGWWRLGDAVDYMLTASYAVLDWAAKYREDLLYNRWRSGHQAVERYREGPPYAYLVPRAQHDPVAPVELLRRLALNGVRVDALTEDVTFEGVRHPAGTWVVPMDQPFAELVRQLFEVQTYPDLREYPEGPPEQPYDAAGWTLPYLMGLRVIEARSPVDALRPLLAPVRAEAVPWSHDEDVSPFDSVEEPGFDVDPVAAGIVPAPGTLRGSGEALVLDPGQVNSYRALNRAWDAGARVRYRPPGEGEGGRGMWVVSGLPGELRDRLVRDLALRAERGAARGVEVARPRIGLYRPWVPSMDEGWTRWLLERYGFAFTNLTTAEVRAGALGSRFDVVVLPSERAATLRDGFEEGSVPPQYAGGLGDVGLRALDAFVREGGTLVCLSQCAGLVIEALDLPVEDVVAGLGRDEFFSSGSLMEVRTDPAHPATAGSTGRSAIFFDRSPVFTTRDGFRGRALAVYPTEGSPLLSGYLLGEERLRGHAAALDVRHGDGHVLLLGFRPQWRGQPFGTFPILFGALLHHGPLASAEPGSEGFWTPPEPAVADTAGAEGPRPGR